MAEKVARVSLIALSLWMVVSVTTPAMAQPPPIPHSFYGAVEINGEPAPVGTQVEARGTGVQTGVSGNPITVTQAGQYGGPGGFDPKLVVQGEIADGTPIYFYVNGAPAQCAVPGGPWQESYPFRSGAVTELNLRVLQPTATPTTTATNTPTSAPTNTPTSTPTPPYFVTATPTPKLIVVTNTPTAANAATAEYMAALATAIAFTTGTPTPLPPYVVTATPTPPFIYVDQFTPTPITTPTPTDVPDVLKGKIAFISDRSGELAVYVMDPDGSRVALLLSRWPYDAALERETLSPDGNYRVFVRSEEREVPRIFISPLGENTSRRLTNELGALRISYSVRGASAG
ncbi:MAG: hypothetical protein WBW48_10000 [Anaerolineae bacterium]